MTCDDPLSSSLLCSFLVAFFALRASNNLEIQNPKVVSYHSLWLANTTTNLWTQGKAREQVKHTIIQG